MIATYLVALILIFMIAYAGVEGTMRVFEYLDLELRFIWIKFRLWMMKRKLRRQLGLPPTNFSKLQKEIKNDRQT